MTLFTKSTKIDKTIPWTIYFTKWTFNSCFFISFYFIHFADILMEMMAVIQTWTDSTEQWISWETSSRSTSQENPHLWRSPKVQYQPTAELYPQPDESSYITNDLSKITIIIIINSKSIAPNDSFWQQFYANWSFHLLTLHRLSTAEQEIAAGPRQHNQSWFRVP
jgi:hypothetical protein